MMNLINFSANTPDLTYQDKLRVQLSSIQTWKDLSGYDQKDAIESFMNGIGQLFLDYFQYHLNEANKIGLEYGKDLVWAVRPIEILYIYKLRKRLASTDEWDDNWEVACLGRTNIEAFHLMFGEFLVELDAGDIEEYMEVRKEQAWIHPFSIPKNTPKTHWWWFTKI
ncbi:MAG: hypothetical protein LLG04_12835 [Parachlamydia sp.]|nr:hypothetical protein [Parachlamydia sp.]